MNLECNGCGAVLEVDAHHRTALCPYCASPSVIERPPSKDRPAPEFVLGFALGDAAAKARVGQWLKQRSVFAHSGLKRAGLEGVQGLYVPAYLYSAMCRSAYQARIGENYTETQTYSAKDSQGRSETRTKTVTKTDWFPLSGDYAAYVPDILVTASRGLPDAELEEIEPFDLRPLRRYTPALVAGWLSEEASLTQAACLTRAREEAQGAVRARLGQFMPGDVHQDLQFNVDLDDESLSLVLLPVWVLAARYTKDKPPLRVVVNGQTGDIHGKVPLSWMKIATALVLGAAALLWIFTSAHRAGLIK